MGPLTIVDVARHRNGICGTPFTAVIFDDADEGRMIATLFDSDTGAPRCAVYNLKLLAEGVIAFGENSWRGDWYFDALAPLLAAWEAGASCHAGRGRR